MIVRVVNLVSRVALASELLILRGPPPAPPPPSLFSHIHVFLSSFFAVSVCRPPLVGIRVTVLTRVVVVTIVGQKSLTFSRGSMSLFLRSFRVCIDIFRI